jgi:hypothetical protein
MRVQPGPNLLARAAAALPISSLLVAALKWTGIYPTRSLSGLSECGFITSGARSDHHHATHVSAPHHVYGAMSGLLCVGATRQHQRETYNWLTQSRLASVRTAHDKAAVSYNAAVCIATQQSHSKHPLQRTRVVPVCSERGEAQSGNAITSC